MPRSQIDILLNLVPDNPSAVLQHLSTNPTLALQQDFSGYSLLHAAASYSHPDLITALIKEYNVDPNLLDEDGETALFVVEKVDVARKLVELGVDFQRKNGEGVMALEKFEDEMEDVAEGIQIVAYLRSLISGGESGGLSSTSDSRTSTTGMNGADIMASNGDDTNTNETSSRHPPPIPSKNIEINFGTVSEAELGGAETPDPEFRRRIEELAAREDFQSEAGQRELRALVEDAVSGLRDGQAAGADGGDVGAGGDRSRRRVG